jgi:hypothetical protein
MVSNDLLNFFSRRKVRFWSYRNVKKNISSQFFDLDIENPLGRVTLAKLRPTMHPNFRIGTDGLSRRRSNHGNGRQLKSADEVLPVSRVTKSLN